LHVAVKTEEVDAAETGEVDAAEPGEVDAAETEEVGAAETEPMSGVIFTIPPSCSFVSLSPRELRGLKKYLLLPVPTSPFS
jgi:hypothetical protein